MEPKSAGHRRSRATAACLPCRKGRTRCVTEKGEKRCSSCIANGNECVFDTRDGRKERALAKAETEALSRRVNQLEELLRQQNEANATPSTPLPPSYVQSVQHQGYLPSNNPPSVNTPNDGLQPDIPLDSPASTRLSGRSDPEDQLSVVRNLVPSPIRFDMSSGRVRYFGPTTNMNVLTTSSESESLERRETHWPICLVVKDMTMETHDYLMDLYWTCHNSVLHLVHSDAFYHDLERGGTQFYSVFLHLAILATGYKYAHKWRKDIQRLATSGAGSCSTIHEKARAYAKLEHDGPGGIPSLQALGLLADLEFNNGRDDSGWLFAGMSLRLVFDVGLHVDPSPLHLPERETQIRHMVLWACLVRDMHWSLYLGRPTTLKLEDIAPACLSKDFTKLMRTSPRGHEKLPITRIYEQLLKLMGIAVPICDRRTIAKVPRTTEAYLKMASLDEELNAWLNDLPEELKWPPQKEMPSSYYLLYTQYHAALILLHRPFVHYEPSEAPSHPDKAQHLATLSRTICFDNATRIVEVFERYRSDSLDLAQVYGTALAHAGSAATALMGEAILQTDKTKLENIVNSLKSLTETIGMMSTTYPPGKFMASIVEGYVSSVSSQGPPRPQKKQVEASGTLTPTARDGKQVVGSTNPYSFTPTEAASHSMQGLPFLPSSFLEGLSTQDMIMSEQMGYSDYGFNWEGEGGPSAMEQ